MSAVPVYPMPRRIVLSLGLVLVRWARRSAPVRSRPPLPTRAQLIRRHQLDRQLEREREAALRRQLMAPLS